MEIREVRALLICHKPIGGVALIIEEDMPDGCNITDAHVVAGVGKKSGDWVLGIIPLSWHNYGQIKDMACEIAVGFDSCHAMTIDEAAKSLGLKHNALYAAIHRGTLTSTKRHRTHFILYDEVERYRRDHLGKTGQPRKDK